MIFHVLTLVCFGFGLMVGFPYAIVWALFYDEPDNTDEDRLFRAFILGRLKIAAALFVAAGVFGLIATFSTGA